MVQKRHHGPTPAPGGGGGGSSRRIAGQPDRASTAPHQGCAVPTGFPRVGVRSHQSNQPSDPKTQLQILGLSFSSSPPPHLHAWFSLAISLTPSQKKMQFWNPSEQHKKRTPRHHACLLRTVQKHACGMSAVQCKRRPGAGALEYAIPHPSCAAALSSLASLMCHRSLLFPRVPQVVGWDALALLVLRWLAHVPTGAALLMFNTAAGTTTGYSEQADANGYTGWAQKSRGTAEQSASPTLSCPFRTHEHKKAHRACEGNAP